MDIHLERYRKDRGLTLDQLSASSGLSRSYLWKLGRGKASPSVRTVKRLASALSCSVSELIGEGQVPCQWVSIDDRLPRSGQFVIVWLDRTWCGTSASCAGRGHYHSGEGFELPPDANGDVTHWMPWPQEPPSTKRRPEPEENDNERFERLASEFLRETGIMAPGKDIAAAEGNSMRWEERLGAWHGWLDARKTKGKDPAAQALGRKGGKATAARRGKKSSRSPYN